MGRSGYCTKELLERDGPSVFKRGTLMFINHATAAESTARPEGDWTKLAAVTEADAKWMENGPDGPALYAPAAVFSKYAEEVREKAPYTGVSINAYGQYAESATGLPNSKIKFDESKIAPDGKPGLIGKLLAADSIDLVTKAGRDGKLLLESAAAPQHHEGGADDMDAAEVRKLLESNAALLTEVKKMRERQFAGDAIGEVQILPGDRPRSVPLWGRKSSRRCAGALRWPAEFRLLGLARLIRPRSSRSPSPRRRTYSRFSGA